MDRGMLLNLALLWIVVVFNLILTFALIRKQRSGSPFSLIEPLGVGQSAPHFTAATLDGETVSLATYAGRAVAFIFLSPHCGPCRQGLPGYEAVGLQAQQANVEVVLVSTESADETREFVQEMHIRLPVLIAPRETNAFAKDYKAASTPFSCLVDEHGKIQSTGYPSRESGQWKELADSWERVSPQAPSLVLREGR
jgi:peroxiredoxin